MWADEQLADYEAAPGCVWSIIGCWTSTMSTRLRAEPLGEGNRVEAGAGADLEQPLARLGREGVAQSPRVMNGWGSSTQKRPQRGVLGADTEELMAAVGRLMRCG